jgi:hypothetical protein
MNRCLLVFVLAFAAAVAPAHAQRVFERNALRGELQVIQPPEALLNGQPVRLAPGARIRNAQNLIQMSGALLGQTLVVNYTLDGLGLVRDVWILTEAEARRQPWPRTQAEAQLWTFDSTLQRWSKP